MTKRRSGILLHPTALPGHFGIGNAGHPARRFLDFLTNANQAIWQMLPLGPTGEGNSPYTARSSFAGNPLLIDIDGLAESGWLDRSDLTALSVTETGATNYADARAVKTELLRRAFQHWVPDASYYAFAQDAAWWLDDYAIFEAASDAFGGLSWWEWEASLSRHDQSAIEHFRSAHQEDIDYYRFVQFVFARQWRALRDEAGSRGIELVGDVPIYVAHNSSDVWANHQLFHLDSDGQVAIQAGVPPDYFSETGQLWGNPCYRWDVIAETGYRWWVQRFRRVFELVDRARVDHFRGFAAGWQVPSGETTAINGQWAPGPGLEIFEALRRQLGELPLIVEDLGIITPDVDALRLALGYPGMHVLQFGFDGNVNNPHLPHNYQPNSVVYTGTHDNDTTVGWFGSLSPDVRANVLRYVSGASDTINWDFIRLAWMSVGETAIAPVQDVLGLGSEARFNTPGIAEGNWGWRLDLDRLTNDVAGRLSELTATYGRGE